jgi:hypothetical protein
LEKQTSLRCRFHPIPRHPPDLNDLVLHKAGLAVADSFFGEDDVPAIPPRALPALPWAELNRAFGAGLLNWWDTDTLVCVTQKIRGQINRRSACLNIDFHSRAFDPLK